MEKTKQVLSVTSIPSEDFQTFINSFKWLKQSPSTLERLGAYLLEGTNELVLAECKPLAPSGAGLYFWPDDNKKRDSFLKKYFRHLDGAMVARLARIYSIETSHYQFATRQVPFGEGYFFDPFLEVMHWLDHVQLDSEVWDQAFQCAGYPAGSLIRLACAHHKGELLAGKNFPAYCANHRTVICEELGKIKNGNALFLLTRLIKQKIALPETLPVIVELAFAADKDTRETAREYLLKDKLVGAIPFLAKKLESGKANEREAVVKLLWALDREKAHPILEEHLGGEKSQAVKKLIEDYIQVAVPATGAGTEAEAVARMLTVEPLPELDPVAKLPESLLELLQKAVVEANKAEERYHETLYKGPGYQPFNPIKPETVVQVFRLLEKADAFELEKKRFASHWSPAADKYLFQLIAHPEVQLVHVVRLALAACRLSLTDSTSEIADGLYFWDNALDFFDHYRATHQPGFTLRDVAAVFKALRGDPASLAWVILNHDRGWEKTGCFRYEHEAVWPYFAGYITILEKVFQRDLKLRRYESDAERSFMRRNAIQVLQTFPVLPPQLVPMLWEVALGNSKAERPLAQACLSGRPDVFERICQALNDGKADQRLIACEWLALRKNPDGIDPLVERLKVEKDANVKNMILTTLEKLGADVNRFVDRNALVQEAQAGLKKGIPKPLAWFPFDALPPVHWADSSEPVATDILKFLMVQAFSQTTFEPGPMLKQCVAGWRSSEREALGQFILEKWVEQDTLPLYTLEEADQKARKQAQDGLNYAKKYPRSYQPLNTPEDEARLFETFYTSTFEELKKQFKGSAAKEKNILLVAAVCCGSTAVPVVNRYIRTYFGNRLSQAKILLAMLSWVEDFSGIQLLLSVANRFRTKAIREEAALLVNAVAERKGWTPDELGDRTIPCIGFEDGPVMELDYGSRKFKASLDAKLNVLLADEAGNSLAALPDARKDEDENTVKEAKKLFSETKKQTKAIVQTQTIRLYEGMCVERTWSFRDWEAFLNGHPVVGRLCQRLVWAVFDEGVPTLTFRPLEDGTLTDVNDNPVTVAPEAMVRLAHAVTLPVETVATWQQHLNDYEIEPVFDQFNRPVFRLEEVRCKDLHCDVFAGHTASVVKFCGKAEKMGYTRGEMDYERFFNEYRKPFRSLNVQAVIEFSGTNGEVSGTKLEEHLIAITGFRFEQAAGKGKPAKVPLGEVPPVLLSTVWNDVRELAELGSGFDPDWNAKVGS
ncbi:MAG: DUF4132 domain-containing protein [Blastocatellia bacterium]|nr:DUF4132 domain-containing protein [Blastocatellia bacterium]